MDKKIDILEFFNTYNRAAIAFSGGVDSSYLLYAAKQAGADVTAYYVKSQFQPDFELADAEAIAEQTGAEMKIIEVDVLADDVVCSNPPDRCYYCKQHIMTAICKTAAADGYTVICDGTNASDDVDDRPGFKALQEFGICSPLRDCGLTKTAIRERAREAGLPVWNKPAYACLATRIPAGERITADKLERTEKAESALFDMGFRDFRVRMRGDSALIQVTAEQYAEAVDRTDEITAALCGMYSAVVIDSSVRR